MNKQIKIICTGGKTIGLGHIRRSITLAHQIKKEGFDVGIECLSEEKDSTLFSEKMIPHNLVMLMERPNLVIFDHPLKTVDSLIEYYQSQGIKTLALDYEGAMVPDLCISVFEHQKNLPPGNRINGLEYILIREDVQLLKNETNEHMDFVLVVVGGYDILGQGLQAAKILAKQGQAVTLIQSPLDALPQSLSSSIQCYKNPPHLPELMASCKWAVTNGGGCMFELVSLGKPVHVLPQTKKEHNLTQTMFKTGTIINSGLENLQAYDEKRLSSVRGIGKQCIDGMGAQRIVQEMKKLI